MKNIFEQGVFEGERALYNTHGAKIIDSTFQNGESPLKESSDLEIISSIFKWKYPLWYSKNVTLSDSTLLETARSGIWYTHGIKMKNCTIEAPKTFRRSSGIELYNCTLPLAQETLWGCRDIKIEDCSAVGDYFAMNAENIEIDDFSLRGNYAFDGGRNIVVRNAKLLSKDSFWNTENVTIYDSLVIGEYFGWNSKNVKLVNCTVDSNQGFCYIDGLELVNCKLLNTDLAFELSSVTAEVTSKIDSVKNPISGTIKAKDIGEVILDKEMIDPDKTTIIFGE